MFTLNLPKYTGILSFHQQFVASEKIQTKFKRN